MSVWPIDIVAGKNLLLHLMAYTLFGCARCATRKEIVNSHVQSSNGLLCLVVMIIMRSSVHKAASCVGRNPIQKRFISLDLDQLWVRFGSPLVCAAAALWGKFSKMTKRKKKLTSALLRLRYAPEIKTQSLTQFPVTLVNWPRHFPNSSNLNAKECALANEHINVYGRCQNVWHVQNSSTPVPIKLGVPSEVRPTDSTWIYSLC